MNKNVRDRWYLEVIRTRLVGGSCRELLSLMAVRHMTEQGYVSVPRKQLAIELGVHPQRITERITEATRAGLLAKISGGRNGQTSRYAAQIPARQVTGQRSPDRPPQVTGEPIPTDAPGNGTAVTSNRLPRPALTAVPGNGTAVPIRARVTYASREDQPTPLKPGDYLGGPVAWEPPDIA